jgi:hypothetical protein
LAHDPVRHANRHLHDLAHTRKLAPYQLDFDDRQIVALLERHHSHVGVQAQVADRYLERLAKASRISYRKRERTEVRKAAVFGHTETEILGPRGTRRGLQQPVARVSRDLDVGIKKTGSIQARLFEEPVRVQTE